MARAGSSALPGWPDVILPYQVMLERTAMDITKDIQPMTFFRNHSAEVMQHLRATRRPMVLTINGKAAAVVQDAEAYQHLLDLAAEANAGEGIRQGLEDLRGERTRPARAVFDALHDEYGLSR